MLQELGGGIAATAVSLSRKNTGKNIMIAGLVFQVFSLILFTLCCSEFALRVRSNKGDRNHRFVDIASSLLFKGFLYGLTLVVLTILIRSAFRAVELSGGFNSKLFNEQIPFMVLESPMVIIAIMALMILHPGLSFQESWHEADFIFRDFKYWHKKGPAEKNDGALARGQKYTIETAPTG